MNVIVACLNLLLFAKILRAFMFKVFFSHGLEIGANFLTQVCFITCSISNLQETSHNIPLTKSFASSEILSHSLLGKSYFLLFIF